MSAMRKLAQILEVASAKPVIKDTIMLKCDLSTKTFNDNMNVLVGSHLIQVIPTEDNPVSKRKFLTTDKGREFLHRYRNLIILLTVENTPVPQSFASLCRIQEMMVRT